MTKKIRPDSVSISFFVQGKTYYVDIPQEMITSHAVERLEKIVLELHSYEVKKITVRRTG